MSTKVLITGATGFTGSASVREAIALGLDVRAMVRKLDERSELLAKQGAEVVLGDLFDPNTLRAALDGVDTAYFVYPVAPGLIAAAVNFALAAKEAGTKASINLSQRSQNRNSTSNSCRDTYIAEQVLNWSGIPVIHLRPTLFLEWLIYPWQLPYLQRGVLRMPGGKGRHAPIAADDQGRAIAALLKNPEGHIGTVIDLSGPVELDYEQIAAELSEALGRPIIYQDLPIQEYTKSLADMGLPPYITEHLNGAMLDYQNGHMAGVDNNVEKLTGRRAMSVGEFAKLHLHQLNSN